MRQASLVDPSAERKRERSRALTGAASALKTTRVINKALQSGIPHRNQELDADGTDLTQGIQTMKRIALILPLVVLAACSSRSDPVPVPPQTGTVVPPSQGYPDPIPEMRFGLWSGGFQDITGKWFPAAVFVDSPSRPGIAAFDWLGYPRSHGVSIGYAGSLVTMEWDGGGETFVIVGKLDMVNDRLTGSWYYFDALGAIGSGDIDLGYGEDPIKAPAQRSAIIAERISLSIPTGPEFNETAYWAAVNREFQFLASQLTLRQRLIVDYKLLWQEAILRVDPWLYYY